MSSHIRARKHKVNQLATLVTPCIPCRRHGAAGGYAA